MRKSSWISFLTISAAAGVLIGCGGAGGTDPTGGSGGSGGGGALQEQGSARVDVNVETGAVKVTPLGMPAPGQNQSSSLFSGSAISVSSSTLSTDVGELTVKKLQLSIKNNTGETIGAGGYGRLIVDKLATEPGSLDLREFTNVSTIVGPGSTPADGPALSVLISQPTGIARDTDGTFYLAGSGDGTLRKLKDGFVTRIATGIATPGGVALSGGYAFLMEQTAHNLARVATSGGTKFVMAGNGTAGLVDGTGATARFNSPRDIEVIGTTAFIADNLNDRIRKATNLTGGSAVVTTLNVFPVIPRPSGLGYVNLAGVDWLVVTSTQTHKVYLVNSTNGQSFVIAGIGVIGSADGLGSVASFNTPFDVTVSGGAIFVSDMGNRKIRQLMLNEGAQPQFNTSWTVKTLAGQGASGALDGLGNIALFASPRFMETDGSGALIVADLTNNRIRKVNAASGVFPVTGPGGPGLGGVVSIINPDAFTPDPGSTQSKAMYNVAGLTPGGSGTADLTFTVGVDVKSFYFVVSLSADSSVAAALDAIDGSVVLHGSPNVSVRTIAGGNQGWLDGSATTAQFQASVYFSNSSAATYICDENNASIRRMMPDGTVYTIAGLPGITGIGPSEGSGATCSFVDPDGIHAAANDLELFVSDGVGEVVFYLSRTAGTDPNLPESWTASIIAGSPGVNGNAVGSGTVTRFLIPRGIVADEAARTLYIADYDNNHIKTLAFNGGDKTSDARWTSAYFAGSVAGTAGDTDGFGTTAQFRRPFGVALSRNGDLFVSEFNGNRVRVISSQGQVSLLAGSATAVSGYADAQGAAARFQAPAGIAVDNGGFVYVCDTSNRMMRRIEISTGIVRTVAGLIGSTNPADGTGDQGVGMVTYDVEYDAKRGLLVGYSNVRLIERIVRNGKP
jgi:hypothetical protein